MARPLRLHTMLVCLFVLWPAVGLAGDPRPDGNEFRIDGGTSDDHSKVMISMNDSGRFVVVWEGAATTGNAVFLKLFDRHARAITGDVRVDDDGSSPATIARASMSPRGDLAVAWTHLNAPSVSTIYARVFEADGLPRTEPIAVTVPSINNYRRPDIAIDSQGFFVVVWERRDELAPGVYETVVLARLYDNQGRPRGDEFEVIASTPVGAPSVCADGSGDFTVAYSNEFTRRFDRTGTPLGPEYNFAQGSPECAYYNGQPAEIDCARDGEFVVSRSCYLQLGQYESLIQAWLFDSSGDQVGQRFDVTTAQDALGPAMRTSVAMSDDSHFWVTWPEHDLNTSLRDLRGRRYDNVGSSMDETFPVASGYNLDLMHPTLGMSERGESVITWREGSRLYGQRYCADLLVVSPVDRVGCSGESAWFSVDAQGRRPLTYQWRKNGIPLQNGGKVRGADSAILIVDDLSTEDEGSYDCVVSDACAEQRSVTSGSATLTVQAGQTLPPVPELFTEWLGNGQMRLTWTDLGAPEYVVWESRWPNDGFKTTVGTSSSATDGLTFTPPKGARFYLVGTRSPTCGDGPPR